MPNCVKTRNPKYFFDILIFAGRRASESFDYYPKMGKIKNGIYYSFLSLNKIFSLVSLKAKIKDLLKIVFHWPGQKQICSFWGLKFVLFIKFQILFLVIVLYSKRYVFANFPQKYSFLLRSLWFFESENFAAHVPRAWGQIRRFFWMGPIKNRKNIYITQPYCSPGWFEERDQFILFFISSQCISSYSANHPVAK